jgi:APA family basic amino acid/polyamine antiporter
LTFIGKISLLLSSVIAIILLLGGAWSILFYSKNTMFETAFSIQQFGYSLLLLFWALVGWEIIGNYSAEVENPDKTIPRSIFYSAATIVVVSLTVAFAIQSVDLDLVGEQNLTMIAITLPLFGRFSHFLIGFITASLCLATYLLIVGGVSRLMASQATERFYPAFFSIRNRNDIPIVALLCLCSIHLLMFGALALRILNTETLVAIANGFFIANALTGLLAAIRIFSDNWMKMFSIILSMAFIYIFSYSEPIVIAVIVGLGTYFIVKQLWYKRKQNTMAKSIYS